MFDRFNSFTSVASDFFLFHYPKQDVIDNANHGESTPNDSQHGGQEIVPLAPPLPDVHAHRAQVETELRLWYLTSNITSA